jgi:hypothetical protein
MSLGLAATGVWASGLVVDGDYNDHLIDRSVGPRGLEPLTSAV